MRNVLLTPAYSTGYTLIARVKEDLTVYEYILAYGYINETEGWASGNYYGTNLTAALARYNELESN